MPQIRSTNTGISAIVLPTGAIAERLEVAVEGVLLAEVPLLPRQITLVLVWGEWFGPASLAAGLGAAAFLLLFRRRRGRPASA